MIDGAERKLVLLSMRATFLALICADKKRNPNDPAYIQADAELRAMAPVLNAAFPEPKS